jgi:hypothetical protein
MTHTFTFRKLPFRSRPVIPQADHFPRLSGTFEERLHQILGPLIRSFGYPQGPSLIEMQSGFWDTYAWTRLDRLNPIYNRSQIGFYDISEERLGWWMKRVEEVVIATAEEFPGWIDDATGRHFTPGILWRLPHHPQWRDIVPWNRVATLRQAGIYVIERLTKTSMETGKGGNLGQRLRINEWGPIMIGQEHHFQVSSETNTGDLKLASPVRAQLNKDIIKDTIHPARLPGTWLWGDTILYECVLPVPFLHSQPSDDLIHSQTAKACITCLPLVAETDCPTEDTISPYSPFQRATALH